jgi:hypothetical protein
MQAKHQPSDPALPQLEKPVPVTFENTGHQPKIIQLKSADERDERKSSFAGLDWSDRGVPFSPLND